MSVIEATTHELDDGRIEVCSPGVGLWRGAPARGAVVQPGAAIGELEILAVRLSIVAPATARGMVVELPRGERLARVPVAFGDVLLILDPTAAGIALEEPEVAAENASTGALVFRAPSGGRFYTRPAPGKPEFVREGDVITAGQTIGVLEVMKTFNRITYPGPPSLPARARVLRILADNDSDLPPNTPLLELTPVN